MDGYINLDFDGTMTATSSPIEFSKLSGMQDSAYSLSRQLFHDAEKSVDESKTIDELAGKISELYKNQIERGAKLLKGVPVKRLLDVKCSPNSAVLEEALRLSEGRPVNVISYTDERVIRKFVKENNIPVNEIRGSLLDDYEGILTGDLKRIERKDESPDGAVIVNSIGDIGMSKNASKVFVVQGGLESRLIDKALEKYHKDYVPIYAHSGKLM